MKISLFPVTNGTSWTPWTFPSSRRVDILKRPRFQIGNDRSFFPRVKTDRMAPMAARREFPACSLEIIFYRHPARSELNHLHDRKPAEHVLRVFPVRRLLSPACAPPLVTFHSPCLHARGCSCSGEKCCPTPRVYTCLSLSLSLSLLSLFLRFPPSLVKWSSSLYAWK